MNVSGLIRGVTRLVFNQLPVNSNLPYMKGVAEKPFHSGGSLIKLCAVTASSLYVGGFLAHKGASYLEENEIFVPSEDDEDD